MEFTAKWNACLSMFTLIALLYIVAEVSTQRVAVNRAGSMNLIEKEYNANKLPFCNATKDIIYANCFNMKDLGYCDKEKEKMKFYCPLTCKFCKGQGGRYKAPAPPQPKCMSAEFKCCKDNHTAALGPNFLGCPERCNDTPNYACSFYKTTGFCAKNSVYYASMLERCPFTCQYCKPNVKKPLGDCYDVWKSDFCERFQKHDLCTSLRWEKRLTKNCRKSCRKCTHNAPTLLSVASECSKNNSCCWDKSPRINGQCPFCKNIFGKSFCNSFSGDCADTSAIKGVQIRIFCTKKCGMCDAAIKCEDDIIHGEFCAQWKKRGECMNNPKIMATYCKQTCGFC